jgi:hypothetical protein
VPVVHAAHLCMQALGWPGAPITGTRPAKVPFKFDFFLEKGHRMPGAEYICIIKSIKKSKS